MSHAFPNIALVALHAGYTHSSLALPLLKAACGSEPFYAQIQLLEYQLKADPYWLLETLVQQQPRLVGFSCYLWNIDSCLELVRKLKCLLPHTLILLGGPEAGARAADLLSEHQEVDVIVRGEGEEAFAALLRSVLLSQGRWESIAGLSYRDHQGQIRHQPEQSPDLSRLPSPWLMGLMDLSRPLIYWETSRGCPFRCSFCASAEERLRLFPLERIEAELAYISAHGRGTLKLLDRSFHLGRKRTLDLLRRMINTPEGLRFHLELNPDRISAEAMALFAQAPAGKFQFEIGLQTLDEQVLKRIDRQMEVDKALANIAQLTRLRRHGVHLDLLVGLPGEDGGQCRDALNRTFTLYPDHLQLGILKLLPGTPLRHQADRFGYRWSSDPPYEVLAHQQLDFFQLAQLRRYAELLERLWNNGLLRHGLMALVEGWFGGHLSDAFDHLLAQGGEVLVRERPGPERIFCLVLEAWGGMAEDDSLLSEMLLWDYVHHTTPGQSTPAWIREHLPEQRLLDTPSGKRRLPVVCLSQGGAVLVNRLLEQPLEPGNYAVWPRKHRKGVPVERFLL